jgi:hypothetical protein
MTLLEKQMLFSRLVSKLIQDLIAKGYDVTLGEAFRSPETCELMAREGKGIKNSLHDLRLAIDLCLFLNGVYLKESEAYLPAGVLWESYSTPLYQCSWGGRFQPPAPCDGNHFSLEHEGYR